MKLGKLTDVLNSIDPEIDIQKIVYDEHNDPNTIGVYMLMKPPIDKINLSIIIEKDGEIVFE
jgi:hypothetical protein